MPVYENHLNYPWLLNSEESALGNYIYFGKNMSDTLIVYISFQRSQAQPTDFVDFLSSHLISASVATRKIIKVEERL